MVEISKMNTVDIGDIAKVGSLDIEDIGAINNIEVPAGNGDRAVFAGGEYNGSKKAMDYITMSTPGNAADFGDLTEVRWKFEGTSNGVSGRGLWAPGDSSKTTTEYITVGTLGNAQDFGNIDARQECGACSNSTNNRGVIGLGHPDNTSSPLKSLEYVTISSLGNASSFGDATQNRRRGVATDNGTNNRGIFAGGWTGSGSTTTNRIDYITISSLGNASDFGDLTEKPINGSSATSNTTGNRGIFWSGMGNSIYYINITSTGNTSSFGDLAVSFDTANNACSTSNGTSNRGIFCGGWRGGLGENHIDYITITSLGNAAYLGDLLSIADEYRAGLSNAS